MSAETSSSRFAFAATNAPAARTAAPSNEVHLTVKKRDGKDATFRMDRVVRAIALAAYGAKHDEAKNPHRDSPENRYGLDEADFKDVTTLALEVRDMVIDKFGSAGAPCVEDVQDLIELTLLKHGRYEIARHYIFYRIQHAELRPVHHGDCGLQDYVAISRYCRYDEALGRREVWSEACDRVANMHLSRFAKLADKDLAPIMRDLVAKGAVPAAAAQDTGALGKLGEEIRAAFDLVSAKKVLPSMRSLQFGGRAIEVSNARIYNCTASPVNRTEFFREYFYLLLCGCGCGFSVQKQHVAQLPALAARGDELDLEVIHYEVPDTVEGWADSLHELFKSYIWGYKVEFSFSKVRRRGAILRTSGGKAPGHLPLKRALTRVEQILAGAAGRQLRPIEVYDICMHVAQSVLSGGIRRSATICLFSPDDEEMMAAKTGDWFTGNPQRSASNNSAVLIRGETSRETYQRLFECQKQFGEPGFYFVNGSDPDVLPNPCVEIALNPRLVVTSREIEKLRAYGYEGKLEEGMELWGWQMCNLSTISGSAAETPEQFFALARAAALIGTVQASYTDIPYLGPVTRVINEREALIGVSICGVLDNPSILLDAATLRRGAEVVKAINAAGAAALGINRAARTTCVKPEGTSSLVLNAGSGIHPHHARRYFRRVQAASTDPIYKWFKQHNPHMCEKSVYNEGTEVITFPVEAAPHALLKDDVPALRLLEYVRLVQENWVQGGRAVTTYTDAHHNVSNTITVQNDEWPAVAEFIWENQHAFTGVALLGASGDKDYRQAPRESVSGREDIRRWNSLHYTPVDYAKVPEKEDHTAGLEHRGAAVACSGGTCEVEPIIGRKTS